MSLIIKSIGNMHVTKDTMRGQLSSGNITTIINNLATLNVTHLGMECPIDDFSAYVAPQPTPGYPELWIAAIRAAGKKVWFRGTWNSFEGNYTSVKRTPGSSPATPLGAAATVLSGADTTSYLYQTWNFIKTHASFFATGDVWAPMPEPENQGIGGAANQMFPDYNTLGQWLVDLKVVSDNAFASIGISGVITGMTSINGGTAIVNLNNSTYWSQIGRVCIDHYVIPSQYSSDLDTIHNNTGVDVYFGEVGTTQSVGSPGTDADRATLLNTIFTTFASKSYVKGIDYFQSVASGGGTENILDNSTYALLPLSSQAVKTYYQSSPPVITPNFVTSSNGKFMLNGKRFQFIGVNCWGLTRQSRTLAQIQQEIDYMQKDGISVVRLQVTGDKTNTAGNYQYLNGTTQTFIESSFVQLDNVLNELSKRNMKALLMIGSQSPDKGNYCSWSNTVYSTAYDTTLGDDFHTDTNIANWYKASVNHYLTRVNTVNGITYSNDPTIFSWELCSECNYQIGTDTNNDTHNSARVAILTAWQHTMAAYVKSLDSNHLVGLGSNGNFVEYNSGDQQYVGTSWGQDYERQSLDTNVDYFDFHMYPFRSHADTSPDILRNYGQALGVPNTPSLAGFIAMLDKYIAVAKTAGKPLIIGEYGVEKQNNLNDKFVSYPRYVSIAKVLDVIFSRDADGICFWFYTYLEDDPQCKIKPDSPHDSSYNLPQQNVDDTILRSVMRMKSYQINGKRIPVSAHVPGASL